MTDRDQQRFGEGLLALGIAFRTEITDDLIAAFRAGLGDVDIDHLVWAMREGLRRCEFFPSVAALRSLADKAAALDDDEAEVLDGRLLNPGSDERAQYKRGPGRLMVCPLCEDIGWQQHVCSDTTPCGNRLCAQYGSSHPFVTPCPCRETNPNFLRRLKRRRRYRHEV